MFTWLFGPRNESIYVTYHWIFTPRSSRVVAWGRHSSADLVRMYGMM